jgi:competence ComEA-like helix-hairpin-helix protein
MTRSERRSLILLGLLAISGHLILGVRGASSAAPGAVTLFPSDQLGDPLAHRDRAVALATPLGAGERVDVERATAPELQRLPGVGPALAKRIVADRENRGAFGGIAGLDRVPGIGPAMLQKLAPHLSFGGKGADALVTATPAVFDPNTAGVAEWDALPGIGASRARAIVAFRDSAGPFRQLDDLLAVPGIPARVIHGVAGRLRLP